MNEHVDVSKNVLETLSHVCPEALLAFKHVRTDTTCAIH